MVRNVIFYVSNSVLGIFIFHVIHSTTMLPITLFFIVIKRVRCECGLMKHQGKINQSINLIASNKNEAAITSQPKEVFKLAKRFLTPVENFFQNEVKIPASPSSSSDESKVMLHQDFPFFPPPPEF